MNEHSVKKYLILWAVNALVVYLAPFIAPGYVVLGNDKMTAIVAASVSAVIIVLLMTLGMKLASYAVSMRRGSEALLGGILLVVNTLSVWITARAAVYTGFGIASFWISIGFAVILSGLELWVWQMITTKNRDAFPVEPVSSASASKKTKKKSKKKSKR